jgi:hypothetical protein
LALLAFAAALLAGTFASAMALAQAQRSARASAEAEALARRATAQVLASWPASNDVLPVHAYQDQEDERPSFGRTAVRTRIQRISASVYVVTADIRVGDGPFPIAHRRARLVLERPASADSGGLSGPPQPIARWGFSTSY